MRLYVEEDKLIPKDERFKDLGVLLEKSVIIDLLKKREIYPSLFVIFAVLNFYAGIKPLVGYGSVTYLHLMKEAWLKTLKEMKMDKEVKLLINIQTNGLIAGLSLAFKRFDGKLKALFAYDVFFEGGLREDYLKKVLDMSYSDFFYAAAIEMYFYTAQKYIPESERIKPKIVADDFSNLTFKWL